MIRIKRVYEQPEPGDGVRYLVDRLWPRGMKKENLKMTAWLKEVAPSPELRRWFGHDPEKWGEFQARYRAELEKNPEACRQILEKARHGNITLLYSARDTEHNSAWLLKAILEEKLEK